MQICGFAFRSGPAAIVPLSILIAAGFSQKADAGICCHYGLTITTAATRNVSFRHGVFRPIKKQATLNLDDLEKALATQDIVVTTGNGSGGTQHGDLHIEITGLIWSSKHTLTLDAYHSIFVDEPVMDAGGGVLTLTTNDGGQGGMFLYGPDGYITILDTSSALTINAQAYMPVQDLPTLASDISANPSGYYALASSYDAENDHYGSSPIAATLNVMINGLGNTISDVEIDDTTPIDTAGLLREVGKTGTVQDLRLSIDVYMAEPAAGGGLAGVNLGQLIDDSVQSAVRTRSARDASLGGIAGTNSGTIMRCNVAATVSTQSYSVVGGLIGSTAATSIADSYSTASVSKGGSNEGGLVGANGNTQGNNALIATSYSTGSVRLGGHGHYFQGGLVGIDNSMGGSITTSYWDTTTSGVTNPDQGAGSPANDPGITGETNSDLQTGLPAGFSPTIWAQTAGINGGLPYLIANPPPQ